MKNALPDSSNLLFDAQYIKSTLGIPKIRYGLNELNTLLKAQTNALAKGIKTELIYVMKEDGELVFSLRLIDSSYLPHPVLSKGGYVKLAGTLEVENGQLLITNHSGHFMPRKDIASVQSYLVDINNMLNSDGFNASVFNSILK